MMQILTSDDFLDPCVPMDFMLTGLWRPYPAHQHQFVEINLITNGTVIERINGRIYCLHRGHVVILTPGDTHDTLWAGKATGMLVRYLPRECAMDVELMRRIPGYSTLFTRGSDAATSPAVLQMPEAVLHNAEDILTRLGEEFRQKRPGYRIQLQGLLYQYIVLLCRQHTHRAPCAAHRVTRVLKVLKHIEVHYKEAHAITTLAAIAGMTRRTFLRVFADVTGLTPIQYLIHHRVLTASVYLRNAAHPVRNIARAVGFTDTNYFARQFRKVLHISPTDYRRHGHVHDQEPSRWRAHVRAAASIDTTRSVEHE